ncbi:alkylation response protein AidB-like acyl-CoA dehydrogenase [Streptosporangium becharense]|uniref:Alkylation response protein AidB-like acyl-CoA dehydrogenase n=1 Tax=Streptosporangium becharense TaxID=1816182 RepID=A0A7W9MGB6_9ACTN|nr:acyl-CoA dehydrogenase [Streptosporangium becharense]MBB2909775.1 alkylation response protein AidB-like acyl-CoA dehydrogenase [Streptosporangium becharense]MBB5819269.1 alkylation response protein AidB-like acyl-CoA dehydrogenase [Streptosporangium becharense]
MAIGLSEEHEALRESVTGWAERNIPAQVVRAAVAADAEERPGFWSGLADQGLLGLHIPEEHGGSGYGLLEAAVAVEALGEYAVPGPYVPTVLAGAVILASDGKAHAELLPALADGTLTGAVALTGSITATRGEDGALTVTGTAEPVLGGSLADVLVLPVSTGQGEEWVAVDASAATVTPVKALDLTRGVARVELDAVSVPAGRVLGGLRRADVLNLAAILLGAEAAGVASWCVTAAAEYAKIRVQFGRPIGQFQGVKHKAARMLVALEQARATVWDAVRAAEKRAEGDAAAREFAYAAAIAGVTAPDAAVLCAKDAIQIFGGIGYTYEHDVHLYYRRALTLRALLGASTEWAESVAGLALDGVRRDLEIELPEDAAGLRETIRAELAEIATLEGREQKRALAAAGYVMPHLPRPWGRDAKPLEQVLIFQELKAAGLKLPQMIIGAWVVPSIVTYGTPEQQERFLPPTLSGEMIWCQLFSEPGAGSDLASLQMRAERVEGGWRLNGQKIWTSVAHVAEWGICIARDSAEGSKHEGITYFLVDMKGLGVTVRPLTEMTGENLFNEVFLDDVFVPDELVVGEVGQGWKVARNTLSNERVSLSSGSGGTGASVPDLLGLAGRLGRELTAAERQEVARVVCEGHSIAALGLRVTLKQLTGAEPGADASVRKLLSTSHAQHVSECAVSLLGPAAVTAADMRLGDAGYWNRAVLSTRAMTIYGGTTEVQLNIIGERMLGLPRDPEPGK